MYRDKKIFSIAIDAYDGVPLKRLDNPVKDANRLLKVLQERYNYSIATEPLFDERATREGIEDGLFGIADNSYEEDVLIIFFAGHGNRDEVSERGFWNPIDGQDNRRRQRLVWNSAVVEAIETMKFKHILLISDSCFSGTFISRMRVTDVPSTLDEADQLESRWVFASGGEESVKDGPAGKGSPFMTSICKFLETNRKRRFPATDLFEAVKADALNEGWKQKPNATPLSIPAHKGGVLVFESNDAAAVGDDNERLKPFRPPAGPVLHHYIPRTVSPRKGDSEKDWFVGLERDRKRLIDLMEYERKLVLLGNAGSGKSRELQRLYEELVENSGRFIPIYKRFNTYIEQQLGNFLPEGWGDVDPYMAVFILDGLDEVQPQYFGNAVRSIEEFIENNPQSRMVISCRTNFYELPGRDFSGTLSSFAVYELNDISLKEIRDYAANVRGVDGDKFIKEVYENRFADLVQKPFFLEDLLQYFEDYRNLNARRSMVIKETLMTQIIGNRQHLNATAVGRRLTAEVALDILERIGFIMEQMGKNTLTDRELRTIFPDRDSYEMVQALPSFYLDEAQGRWQFEHNNVQEFLAASVLKNQSFDHILRLITTASGKIKPGWVNTLSFFVSIGEDAQVQQLLDWMVEHDPEFIFRFEAERIPDALRQKLALDIIRFHARENIWFSSNKYSEEDIARIGAYPEVIDYLLHDLQHTGTSRIVISNAFRVLRHMDWGRFAVEKVKFKESLLNIISNNDGPDDFIYSILNTIGDLHLVTDEEVYDIVQRYRNSVNAYLRAGLYSLIISYDVVDEYVDAFIEGLHPESIPEPTDTRSDVSLLDEQVRLHDGITKVKTEGSIIKLLAVYNKPGAWRHFSRDENKAFLDNIVKQAVALFANHEGMYGIMLTTLRELALHGTPDDSKRVAAFFVYTGTAFDALMDSLSEPSDYVRAVLISLLIDFELVPRIISAYEHGVISEGQVRDMHQAISWNNGHTGTGDDVLNELGKAFLDSTGVKLEKPTFRRWADIQKESAQLSFDILFDREKFKEGIATLYREVEGTAISWTDVVKVRAREWGSKAPDAIFSFISHFFRRETEYPMERLISYVDSSDFEWYVVHQAFQYLERGNEHAISVNEKEKSFIVEWCKKMAANINLDHAIANAADVVRVLWYFIREYGISLPNAQLLTFTLYYDFRKKVNLQDPGTIDVLRTMLNLEELHDRVLINLSQRHGQVLAWLNNASYAVSHQLENAYSLILERLKVAGNAEYKYEELLALWVGVSGNIQAAKEVLALATNISLRLRAAKILSKHPGEKQFVAAELFNILQHGNASDDEKLAAAKQMAVVDDVRGLAFITERVRENATHLDKADIVFGYSLAEFRSIEALPYILELISIALRPDLRPRDRHGFFFSKVLEALYNIGLRSRLALSEVTREVNRLIAENEGKLVDLEVLKVNLRRMEEQFSAKEDHSLTLEEAIKKYDEIKKT